MQEWEELRASLVRYVKIKFYSRQSICELADDIVNEAFAEVFRHGESAEEKANFGYMSKVCIHVAFRVFKKSDCEKKRVIGIDSFIEFVDAKYVVEEIMQSEDTKEILNSLETLKEIEKVIIMQRYYGDYSFAEISKANDIKLNTVLSHHRRALEKLRPRLSTFAEDRVKKTELPKEVTKIGFMSLF